ncbi:MAG: TetR/AcrR family transcriptional regulator [Dehalococcoidia bacterium]|jgi:AcrR family transcriptional regulator|nr:TetR/AcrR family transcriptional regulator [Dehalococcoidia bacterium]MDP7202356.1 TetR/AcrR family transcriptional regulator [Dehalococcoidia bacterium]HJN87479.1 TetR/AcrR family transcriptional regulator [Dehalococcoidia bacterium]
MPKVSEQYLDERRQHILGAATACFARQGFHRTTMQDIYNECGLSPGAVYNYFSSKDDIIVAACLDSQEDNSALMEDIAGEQDTRLALEQLISAIIDQLDAPGVRAAVGLNIELWAEALHNPRVGGLLEGIPDPLIEIIVRGQRQGEISFDLDPEAVVRVIAATINGLIPQIALDDSTNVQRYGVALTAILTGRYWTGPATSAA